MVRAPFRYHVARIYPNLDAFAEIHVIVDEPVGIGSSLDCAIVVNSLNLRRTMLNWGLADR